MIVRFFPTQTKEAHLLLVFQAVSPLCRSNPTLALASSSHVAPHPSQPLLLPPLTACLVPPPGELEYVITDVSRGAVVDFFTVWLPAPTLSFTPVDEFGASGFLTLFSGLPENAFQRGSLGRHWGFQERALAVLVGGAKLFLVGAVSSVGTVAITNGVRGLQERLRPQVSGFGGFGGQLFSQFLRCSC